MAMLSDWLAAVAIVISMVALVSTVMGQRESHRLQARLVELEEARQSDLAERASRAEFAFARLSSPGRASQLVIRNTGQSEARNIKLEFDGQPCHAHHCGSLIRVLPHVLAPGCEVTLPLVEVFGIARPLRLRLAWSDRSGGNRSMETAFP